MRTQSLLSLCPFLLGVLLAPLASAEPTVIQEAKVLQVGGYVLNNNVWGKDKSPQGWQLIDVTKAGDPLSWTVRYNWPAGSDKNAVKCYPSVITGWHWGLWSEDRRLPKQLSSLTALSSGATAVVTHPGVQNVAYDLWFHTTGTPTEQSKPSDELMIWTQSIGGAGPLGQLSEKVTIDGAEWSLFIGDIGWNVFSFIRAENTETTTLNIKAFIDHLVKKGLMPKTKFLTSVQFGTEVFSSPGDASVEIRDYFVKLQTSNENKQ